MKGFIISALSSGEGKTLVTQAFLNKFQKESRVQPFKIGPDYIDPQFHRKICSVSSINLDLYMMNSSQVRAVFNYYTKDCDITIGEGVMGYYDGIDKGYSTYDVAKSINCPVILILSAGGSYSTLSAQLSGILQYRKDNTIKGIILNKISSEKHYNLIKDQIEKDLPKIKVLGWIPKLDINIPSRHLGLDLSYLNTENYRAELEKALYYIDIPKLEKIINIDKSNFELLENAFDSNFDNFYSITSKLTLTIVQDSAFSFLYEDNIQLLKKLFKQVYIISALNNDIIPSDTDTLYLPGGYVETEEIYPGLQEAYRFKESLITYSQNKNTIVYAECAGLIYLGSSITTNNDVQLTMMGILPLKFKMNKRYRRLGYYSAYDLKTHDIYRGHAFHYSDVINPDAIEPRVGIFKDQSEKGDIAGWQYKNIYATYLHVFLRNNLSLLNNYFIQRRIIT